MKKILILLLVSVSSCKPVNYILQDKKVKDSIATKTTFIPKDTTIVIPSDSVKIKKLISELSEKPTIKRSNRATLSLKRIGNSIEAECKTEELKQIIKLQKELIEVYKSREIENNETVRIPVRYIPKLIKWLAYIGGTFLLSLIVLVVLKIKKII